MENFEELRAKKPKLYQVACKLAAHENPDRALNALKAIFCTSMKGVSKHEQQ